MENRRWQPYTTIVFGAWVTMLTGLYFAFSSQRLIFLAIGLSGVAGILAGVHFNRPTHRLPWLLLAAANLAFASGEAAQIILIQFMHENSFPSIADGFYLATYLLYAGGLLSFVRLRTARRDRASVIDALTLTAGLAMLCWIYVIAPYVRLPGLSWIQQAISIGYPLGDILVLAMLLGLLAPRGQKSTSLVLLTVGTTGLLVSDIAYALIQLHGTWHTGTPVDLGWAVFYGAWGAAALHPSMVTLTQPTTRTVGATRGRLALLVLASLIAPAVLILEASLGNTRDAGVIGAFSALLFVLVLCRLANLAAALRRTAARERVLRDAVAALGAAADLPDVAAAVRTAAALLIPARWRPDAYAVLWDSDEPEATWDEETSSAEPGEQADLGIRELTQQHSVRLVDTASLGEGIATKLVASDVAVVCPMALPEQARNTPAVGVLIVAGDERDLLVLHDSLATLTVQAALAVERITLTKEIGKRNSEAYFRTLVQNSSDVILILDDDNRIRYVSPSAERVLGVANVSRRMITDLVPTEELPEVLSALHQMRSRSYQDRSDHWRMERADNRGIEVEVRCSDLRDDATVRALVLTLRDVTEQRKLERELVHQAFHDSLTGLANRVLFQERITHAIAQGQRSGAIVGVLFIDVDDFKVINDTQGHAVGDELLVAISLRLSTAVRVSDTGARIGGDEFALLVEGAMAPQEVETFADHVIGLFAEPFRLKDGPVSVYASVGIATTEDSFESAELLMHADLALYEAKTAGKRQWRRYRPALESGMVERHALQEGLDGSQVESFDVLYQPIVELVTGRINGFEALVRWPHSTRGTVLPEQFITLAEESGQIVPLGAWVLGQAATEARRWQGLRANSNGAVNGSGGAPYVSVNVSPRQFRDNGFLGVIQQALEQSGIAPTSLVLELTESLLMHRDDRIMSEMHALTELGIRIAIDDFGTGYSSLSYLREFPISILKIDKSFIDDLGHSPQQYALVEGIIHLADTLGVKVIAEGVETAAQQRLLIKAGCPLGQGYLFARPVDPPQARLLIQTGVPAEGAL